MSLLGVIGSAARRRLVGGVGPISTPPALWLSDTGSDPSVWPDLSGNGRNATQATVANQPAIILASLNGRQVRRFDGVNDLLKTGATGLGLVAGENFTWFAVMRATGGQQGTPASRAFQFEISVGQFSPMITTRPFNLAALWSTEVTRGLTADQTSVFDSIDTDEIALMVIRGTSTTFRGYKNGLAGTAVTYNATLLGASRGSGIFSLGGFDFKYKGDFAEILVYTSALSDADRLDVETYLNAKYAIY